MFLGEAANFGSLFRLYSQSVFVACLKVILFAA